MRLINSTDKPVCTESDATADHGASDHYKMWYGLSSRALSFEVPCRSGGAGKVAL